MTRLDSISNRNIKIIAAYVKSRLGSYQALFSGLSYPSDEYRSPVDFFMNEDEWTTYENFQKILRRGKELVGEPDFFFNCGASSVKLRSLGRIHYFERVFATPNDGFKRLPSFTKNFVDTKDISLVLPPVYDRSLKKIRTILRIEYHSDFDADQDYIGDPYTRGIISSIPTMWGLPPASIKRSLNPYNPEVLFNQEPEFIPYALDVKIEGDIMTLNDPLTGERRVAGRRVILEHELVNGQKVFLGKYREKTLDHPHKSGACTEAILITETISKDGRILLNAGEVFMAPYFILDVTYDQMPFLSRLTQIFRLQAHRQDVGTEMLQTIDELRRSIRDRNEAFLALKEANARLREAKAQIDEYAQKLEQKVEERTEELRKAQQNLLTLNHELEKKVKDQVDQLERYNELRRYLSPKITEQILTSGQGFGTELQRKTMTVVFTDIRDFSGLTDNIEPEELFYLLDRYLTEMIKIVHLYDGTLNKIVGDGLLIFFGAPIEVKNHAEQAVHMAIDMQRRTVALRDDWNQYGHELGVGIGINTGFMTVGNIGSDTHRDYTVIGNQVNVAARLESIAKPGQILISQRTYSKVKDHVETEDVGDISVKGIHTPVRAYSVLW